MFHLHVIVLCRLHCSFMPHTDYMRSIIVCVNTLFKTNKYICTHSKEVSKHQSSPLTRYSGGHQPWLREDMLVLCDFIVNGLFLSPCHTLPSQPRTAIHSGAGAGWVLMEARAVTPRLTSSDTSIIEALLLALPGTIHWVKCVWRVYVR